MAHGDKWLENLAEQMKRDVEGGAAPNPEKLTVREFLYQFGYLRRTRHQVAHIRNRLRKYGLRTNPDFVGIWVDHVIAVELVDEGEDPQVPEDPTVRVGELEAAHQGLTSVKRDETVSVATGKMLLNDFSQLPVMQNSREVDGVISWKSIGSKYALRREWDEVVRNCMEPAKVIGIDSPLLTALEDIYEHGYVLVKDDKNVITGIVTASDVAQQFKQLTGPFLLIGEIEGHLRNLIFGKFTAEEMTKAAKATGSEKPVSSAVDLTFGGYCNLLEPEDRWNKLGLKVDRKVFIERLKTVRDIRNDVMHFNADGLDEEQMDKLEGLVEFFRGLKDMGAI